VRFSPKRPIFPRDPQPERLGATINGGSSMSILKRAGVAVVALAVAGVLPAAAQNAGLPLFTNPRYGTGIRLHLDAGKPADAQPLNGYNYDQLTLQGGVSLAIGPVGLNVAVAGTKADLESGQTCAGGNASACDPNTVVSGGALAQLRVMGGGSSNLSLSVFGGVSTQFSGWEIALNTFESPRALTIPVGAALGLRIPLGVASLNLWGAPRYSITKISNCPAGATCDTEGSFRWAVGADFPVFRVLSVRAAFDAGEKVGGVSTNVFGAGVSLGVGGMR